MSRPITMSDSITTNVCIIKSKSNYSWQRCFLIASSTSKNVQCIDQTTFFLCSFLSTKQTYDWNSCSISVFSLLWMQSHLHKSPSFRFCFRFHFHCQLHFFILLNKPFFRSCSFLQWIYKCSIFLLLLVVVGFLNNVNTKKMYTFVAIFQVSHAILPLHGSSLQMFSVTLGLVNQTNM